MSQLALQYLPVLIFLGIAAGIGTGFIIAAWVVAPKHPDKEKLSAYECGFNAFEDARMKFDVRFYLVSILFIIFDLEVAFLFPWATVLGAAADAQRGTAMVSTVDLPNAAFLFWSMMSFLGVLTVGFIYEWRKGALEWE
jgi:NADH-quinone oxidoreductase subunit A